MIVLHRSLRTRIAPLSASFASYFWAIVILFGVVVSGAAQAITPTVTTLSISSTNVPYKTPIILTAAVTAAGSPVTTGLVMFCDATALHCENNSSLLATVQLTASSATAVVKIGSGPLGIHSYKAVYRANSIYGASSSGTVSYTVQGTYNTSTVLASSGSVGNYNLNSTVSGVGAITSPGPSGWVSFIDRSAGNQVLGTQSLGTPVLTNTFSQAPNSPFAIGSTGDRSLVVASTYLDGDNNIDIVTGDPNNVISVLLGDGDGTFQPKVNYPGCPVISGARNLALKILLADFNRDGAADIALGCGNGSSGGVAVLLGDGTGSFQSPIWRVTGDLAGLAMGDFDNDGKLDIVVSNRSDANVRVLPGNGDGTFGTLTTVASASQSIRNIVVADFDSDGNDDLAYSVDNPVQVGSATVIKSDLYVATGRGDGSFNSPLLRTTDIGEFLTSGDTNDDNIPDIIASTVRLTPQISNSMFVLIGNGDGTFQPKATYISDIPSDPHLADVNGDGKADIIAGGSYGALVYIGNGDGTFQDYTEPIIGGFELTYSVNAGDYNNDGNADLVGTDAKNLRAAVVLSEVRQAADAVALTGVAVLPLGSGLHDVEATYLGDTIYLTSTSSSVSLRAAAVSTTLSLTSAPATTVMLGDSVTLTATLSPYEVSGPPSTTTNGESVSFYNGSTLLGTGTLNNGVATLTTTALPAGSLSLKAVFAGTIDYLTSTSSNLSLNVSSVVLSSSPNPSDFGETITLTATVISGATGSVQFLDGSTPMGTATVSGTTATLTTANLSAGSHSLKAVYSGDSTHASVTSTVVTQVVNKINPALSVATSGQTTYLSSVTITATVPSNATGTVVFTSGALTLGSAAISSGSASITTTALPVGSNTITASYAGDTNYNAGTATATQVVTKATPASALTSSLNPSTYGSSVTFTNTLPTTVTGTVVFTSNATVLGSANVSNGVATLTTSTLAVGTTTIRAVYSGDSNYNGTAEALQQTVDKLTPSLTLASSVNPSIAGQSVALTATLPTAVTGSVTFTEGSVTLGSVAVSGGIASVPTASLAVGSHTITATYSGDGYYQSTSTTLTQTVNKASTSVGLASSLNPSNYGDTVSLTATVSSVGTIAPGGSVTFSVGSITLGTVALTGDTAVLSTSSLAAGSAVITATYSGDASSNTSSTTLTQTVNKITPGLTLSSSKNPASVGESITFTATMQSTITGTVTFSDGATVLATAALSSGVATSSVSSLAAGSHTITATYNGDANHDTATGSLVQAISKKTPSIAVSTSGPTTYGQSVTITATLPSDVTGAVTFTSGSTTLGTASVNASGVASISTSTLPVGNNAIAADYAGDASNNSVSASTTQAVSKATPTISVTTSGPSVYGQSVTLTATLPSAVTGSIVFTDGTTTIGTATIASGVASIATSTLPTGSTTITATYGGDANNNSASGTAIQTVSKNSPTLSVTTSGPSLHGQTVTITGSLPTTVTGTVSFVAGATAIGTGTVSNGVASVTTSILPVGTASITANYSGDSSNNSATGTAIQIVSKASPVLTLASSLNPSQLNQSVTFTATLPTSVTGTVTFYDGATVLGPVSISSGIASLAVSTLSVGSHGITALYSGDADNNTASGNLTQGVSQNATSITVATSGPSIYGQTVTVTATVPTGATGTVTFTSGSTTIGTGTINSSTGTTSVTTATLPVGMHSITANYSGDTNYTTAAGSTSQTVSKITSTVSVTTSGPSTYGQTVTVTATVPTGATGTVIFTNGSTTIGTGTINPATGTASITTSTLPVGTNTITANYSGDTTYSAETGSGTQTVSKATPAIIVSTSGPSSYGEPVIVTTTLPTGTTGTVTLTSGGTSIGTGTVNPATGVVIITTSTLPVGSNSITATYSGDTNNNTTNGSTTQAVTKSTLSVALVSSLNPSTYGQSVSFTATVPSLATGTITFIDGGTTLGVVPVSSGQAIVTVPTLGAGTHIVTASYSGDTGFNSAVSIPLSQVVNKATPILPAPTVSDANPSPNTPVTITEHIPSGLTGPVTFSNGGTVLGTASIVGGVATITVPSLPVGSDPITASVGETDNYTSATSPSTTVTVGKQTPPVTLISSVNPSTSGQTVTFTATVPTAATGTITFENGPVIIGTSNVVNGVATLSTNTLTSGSHIITATYNGDASFNSNVSIPLNQVVDKATPTLPAPVVSNPTQVYGGTQTISETVPNGVSGPVTFYNGATPIGTAPIVNGVATITVTTLPVGTNSITASTPGDSSNNAATSPATIVTVTKSTPVLPAPIVSDANPNPNTPVTITEQVPLGVTGSITFSNGATVLGSAPIVNGVATITVPSLPLGTNPITASIAETATSNAATSPPTAVTVGLVTPTVTLASSVNPAAYSQGISFTAVVPAGATGTITFLDGAAVLGTGSVNAAGIAVLTTSSLAIGTHVITASYGGDTVYRPATSMPLSQVVSKLPSTITLSISSGTTFIQSGVTLTAVVATSTPTPTGTVTFVEGTTVLGTAALSSNGVGGPQLSGNAALTISTLSSGSHVINAVYSGDAVFLTSTSAPVTAVIHDFTNRNTGDPSLEAYPGDSVAYKFTLTPVGTTTFLSNVNLNVTGLPADATFTVSPASVAGGAGATVVTLTVKTSAKLNTATSKPASSKSGAIAFALIGLVGLGTVRRYRRRMPRLLMMLLLVAGSLLPIASLTGCAGGYYSPKPTSYTVTLTATEGTLQRTATATLIVQQ